MSLTVSQLGALFLVFFGLFYWLGIFARLRALLAFFGAVAVGTGGAVGHLLARITGALAVAGGDITGWLFGAAISGILFLIALTIFIHDLHPRNGASRRTGWIALLLGASLAAASTVIPALAPVVSGVNSLMAGLASFINSL